MFRTAALAALAAIPTFALLQSVHSAPSTTPAPCSRVFAQEPVLFWDSTGSTFLGLFHRHMAIYSNGLASISKNQAFFGVGVQYTMADPDAVAELRQALAAAGAFQLCDYPLTGNDVPLQTVTLFGGGPNAPSHTFSFYFPDGAYGDVQAAIQKFISVTFPSF
ncbi:MAG TPA: hypothetical protein VKE69_11440 [Planctomycetota bacterium]|nr:hypothetical protein [Planctomycetota bacterium]